MKKAKQKNPFWWVNVIPMRFDNLIISETRFKTDFKTKKNQGTGILVAYWYKTKSVTIERSLCGFCLN